MSMKEKEFRTEFQNNVTGDLDLNLGLTINTVGYKSIVLDKTTFENKIVNYKYDFKKGQVRNEFKLIYITQGSGIICFDGSNEMEISEGKILLIYPQQSYDYYYKALEWKEYYIRFDTDDYYFQIIKRKFGDYNSIIDIGYNEEIIRLIKRTMDVVCLGQDSSQAYLSGMLFHALGLVLAASSVNKPQVSKNYQIVQQSKVLMNDFLFQEISIPDIAARLNVSYSYFRSAFKKETGTSPAKYLNELKLRKAKQLLLETTYSIKEIALMLNSQNPEHFFLFFKKNTGLTPSEYRLKSKGEKNKSEIL